MKKENLHSPGIQKIELRLYVNKENNLSGGEKKGLKLLKCQSYHIVKEKLV